MIEVFAMLEILIILCSIILGLMAVQSEKMLHAIVAFFCMSIVVAAMFFLLGAIYAAAFQILVYGGFLFVLLLTAFQTIRRE